MPQDARIYDGFDAIIAQDSQTDASYLPGNYVSESCNRIFRGGKNRTRPGFSEIILKLGQDQDSGIMSRFQQDCFQGACAYQSIKYDSTDGICVSVGGIIYFIALSDKIGYLYQIASGNDNTLMNSWYCQAEDWLYIQNGYQNAIAWDGVLGNSAIRLNPEAKKMPIGTIMAYAQGRVFVSDVYNNIYASDIIFGNGTTVTSNTQNFTETTYWSEGGQFVPPSTLGKITGMAVMPSLNNNSRGQGEVLTLCYNGSFTLDAIVPRPDWKDAQIQKISMIGRGCLASSSVTPINNEIIYRSGDGWSFYNNAQYDFINRFSFRKISAEVNKYVDKDTDWLIQFASGMYFDNRFLGTVSPYTVDAPFGKHRPNAGMIVLDLDQASSASPDAQINLRWNGIWTGPQVTQFVKANVRGIERGFCFSYDADGKNRLYELTKEADNDTVNGVDKRIKSYFISKRYDFSSMGSTKFNRKQVNGGEMWVSDVADKVTATVNYRSDYSKCWQNWMGPVSYGCDACNTFLSDCQIHGSQKRYKKFVFPTPDVNACQSGQNIKSVQGAQFQLRVEIEGSAQVDYGRISATVQGGIDPTIPSCSDEEVCEPIECCADFGFDYYKTVS